MATVFISNPSAPSFALPAAAAINGSEIVPMDQTVGGVITTVGVTFTGISPTWTGLHTFAAATKVNAGFQVTGTAITGFAGAGTELFNTGTTGGLQAYNRTSNLWLPLVIDGSTLSLRYGQAAAEAIGVGSSGNITMSAPVSGYTLVVNNGASGSKIAQFNATGGASLYIYSDSGGSGVTNSDPYGSGVLAYCQSNTNFDTYIAGILRFRVSPTGSGGLVAYPGLWPNGGSYQRSAAGSGFLDGGYATMETGSTSGAIYSIGGGNYLPGTTNLGNMYGIGYTVGLSTTGVSGIPGLASGWGMYVASNGTANIFLESDNGVGYSTNAWVTRGQQCLRSSTVTTLGGAGGLVSAQAGGTASGGNPGDIILIY